jgi:hypothetical protein
MEPAEDTDIRSLSFINLLLGAWLIVTPFWFGYTSGTAKWNQLIIGIVVMVLAALRLLAPAQKWLSFLTGIAGIWAIIAPFILTYDRAGAYWNEVIVGILVTIVAFYNSGLPSHTGTRTQHHHTHTPA